MVEIKIDVPWGHIAGKWWGPQHIRPIVALHGREQNAGSFDCLIPLLPNHISYLAIDLPGHGLSSAIPLGQIYTTEFYLYVFRLIRSKFQWKHISLMAHSMSSVHSFLYAGLFPDEVDLLIGISFVRPQVITPLRTVVGIQEVMKNSVSADIRAQGGDTKTPAYTYEEMINKTMDIINSNGNRVPAEILLQRGIHQSKDDPTKYFYNRDRRTRIYIFVIPRELSLKLAKEIKIPHCFIRGREDYHIEEESDFDEAIDVIRNTNSLFEYHLIDGGHYVHLVEIQQTAEILSNFIHKYRPIAISSSKM